MFIPVCSTNCSLQNSTKRFIMPWIGTLSLRIFYLCYFMFHVSPSISNSLIINAFKSWNIRIQCFIFSFNVSFQKHWGRKTKRQWERSQNTEGAITKHCGSMQPFPLCFEKWNMKLKMKHWNVMFYFSKSLILNLLQRKMKHER